MANGTWRIARGRGSAQLPLLLAASLAILLLIAGKAHFVPFERARTAITDRAAPALQALNKPVVATTRWFGGVRHFFDVYSENQRLNEENARLLQWRGAALALQDRVTQYERLLKAVPAPAYSAVTARVIARSSQPFLETVVLNAGRRNGVQPGQAVVDARGMLGRIYLAGERTSWVILLTDLNSRIPVLLRPGNVQAILAGNNTATPALEALPQNAKLKSGQDVVTSGDGGLLPPGLPIGLLAMNGREAQVSLFADPLGADEVRILGFESALEQMPKPTDKDLPMNAANLPPPQPPPPPQPVSPQTATASQPTAGAAAVAVAGKPTRHLAATTRPVHHVVQGATVVQQDVGRMRSYDIRSSGTPQPAAQQDDTPPTDDQNDQ